MTVLYICNEYPPGKIGGIGSMTKTLARAMVSAGHKVLVAGLYLPGYGEADFESDHGIKIWRKRLKIDIGLIKNNYSLSDSIFLRSLSASGILQKDMANSIRKFNRFIEELILEFNVDIIEWPDFNDWFPYINIPLRWPELSVPLIIKFHGTQSYISQQTEELVNKKVYPLEKQHIDRATALVSVSRNTAENYIKLYNLSKHVHILYNSIELPGLIYRSNQTETKIVFAGALIKLKGIYSLLKAWNIVHKKHPDATLEIFGKGKINTVIKEAMTKTGHSIHYKGFVSKEELHNAMSTAAAAIFPSYTECFALAPLEAMAAGCPVIYTERASGPELIKHGINGLLIDPDDTEQMAEAMSSLIQSESLRIKFSTNGRRTIEEHFNIDQSVHDHIQFYKQVIRQYQQNYIPS
jgi:glycosyltransferase involved in cell wall biosynthesis